MPAPARRGVRAVPSLESGAEYGERVPRPISWLLGYLNSCAASAHTICAPGPAPSDIQSLLDALEYGGADAAALASPEVAAAALRAYVESLPEALVPVEQYRPWLVAAAAPDASARVRAIASAVDQLPESHREVLHRLCLFLGQAAARTGGSAALADVVAAWSDAVVPARAPGPVSREFGERQRSRLHFTAMACLVQHLDPVFDNAPMRAPQPELRMPLHSRGPPPAAHAGDGGHGGYGGYDGRHPPGPPPPPPPQRAPQGPPGAAAGGGGGGGRSQTIEGSLLRDSQGRFKLLIKEDGQGGVYIDKLQPTDVTDDRQRLCVGDVVTKLDGAAVGANRGGMPLEEARTRIKNAGALIKLTVVRKGAGAAPDAGFAGAALPQPGGGSSRPQVPPSRAGRRGGPGGVGGGGGSSSGGPAVDLLGLLDDPGSVQPSVPSSSSQGSGMSAGPVAPHAAAASCRTVDGCGGAAAYGVNAGGALPAALFASDGVAAGAPPPRGGASSGGAAGADLAGGAGPGPRPDFAGRLSPALAPASPARSDVSGRSAVSAGGHSGGVGDGGRAGAAVRESALTRHPWEDDMPGMADGVGGGPAAGDDGGLGMADGVGGGPAAGDDDGLGFGPAPVPVGGAHRDAGGAAGADGGGTPLPLQADSLSAVAADVGLAPPDAPPPAPPAAETAAEMAARLAREAEEEASRAQAVARKLQARAEARAREEEARRMAEAEAKRRAEEAERLRREAEERRRLEEEERLAREAEERRKEEAEAERRRIAEEEERWRQEEEAARRRAEEKARRAEEARRMAEEEAKRRAEAEARRREAEERRRLEEEEELLRRAAEVQRRREEEEKRRQEEAERMRREAEERRRREEAERMAAERVRIEEELVADAEDADYEIEVEEERRRREEEDRRRREEEERLRREEEEKRRQEEAERLRREAEERRRREEAEALRRKAAEEERIMREGTEEEIAAFIEEKNREAERAFERARKARAGAASARGADPGATLAPATAAGNAIGRHGPHGVTQFGALSPEIKSSPLAIASAAALAELEEEEAFSDDDEARTDGGDGADDKARAGGRSAAGSKGRARGGGFGGGMSGFTVTFGESGSDGFGSGFGAGGFSDDGGVFADGAAATGFGATPRGHRGALQAADALVAFSARGLEPFYRFPVRAPVLTPVVAADGAAASDPAQPASESDEDIHLLDDPASPTALAKARTAVGGAQSPVTVEIAPDDEGACSIMTIIDSYNLELAATRHLAASGRLRGVLRASASAALHRAVCTWAAVAWGVSYADLGSAIDKALGTAMRKIAAKDRQAAEDERHIAESQRQKEEADARAREAEAAAEEARGNVAMLEEEKEQLAHKLAEAKQMLVEKEELFAQVHVQMQAQIENVMRTRRS